MIDWLIVLYPCPKSIDVISLNNFDMNMYIINNLNF